MILLFKKQENECLYYSFYLGLLGFQKKCNALLMEFLIVVNAGLKPQSTKKIYVNGL